MTSDAKYQIELKKWIAAGRPAGKEPTCPECNGKMKAWDCWLVTGDECVECGWGMSEGSGCLA